MLDDRSGPLQKAREGRKENIIIFPCDILNEKALELRYKYFFLHFLTLELSISYVATYIQRVCKPVVPHQDLIFSKTITNI